ncbi:GntR family transcriptional regulator [Butyrivibrio sp. WCE2006]|uniref:GntR family transcriptional regulator n=1 Tax=Butyrivibrio sp. WCE2006 TaxID=1410611 RepID=UPI000A8CDB7F|nr:GntR family transcriptional regulator [Butyrivibrio sp. WCE2006]
MLIEIDYRDKRPLYEQISGKLEELILCGVIGAGEALPSVRSLAMDLSINPNTIQKAYDALEQKGMCYSVTGRGRFAAAADEVLPVKKKEFFDELLGVIVKASKVGITEKEITDFIHEEFVKGGNV